MPIRPMTDNDRDQTIRTLIGEARGEPLAGQEAVAWVIRNRAEIAASYVARRGRPHPLFGNGSLAGACRAPMQFSCWNAGDPNAEKIASWPVTKNPYRALGLLVDAVMAAPPGQDPTQGATHYFTAAAPKGVKTWPPAWALEMVPKGQIGAHLFAREV